MAEVRGNQRGVLLGQDRCCHVPDIIVDPGHCALLSKQQIHVAFDETSRLQHSLVGFGYLLASFIMFQLCYFLQVLLRCANMSPRRGGCVYFLKSVRKGRFRNVCVGGGGGGKVLKFFSTELHIGWCTQTCAAQFRHVYSETSSSFALPFSGRAGTPLGQTSPCLWTGGQKLLL